MFSTSACAGLFTSIASKPDHEIKLECESFKQTPKKRRKPFNPYGRMREPGDDGVAAVVVNETNGALVFSQYQTSALLENPELFRPLIIEQSSSTLTSPTKTPFGDVHLDVRSPGGRRYNSRRFYTMEKGATLLFSPAKNMKGEDREIEIVRNTTNLNPMISSTALDELNYNEMPVFENAEGYVKGKGQVYTIPSSKAHERSQLTSNKKVWNYESAEETMLDFIEKNKGSYDAKQLEILKKLATLFKLEWVHLLGVGLSSKEFNPQTQENMGAGFKVLNTWMMVLEDLAAYFSFNGFGVVTVKPEFIMLKDSEIIEKIYYSVTIKKGDKTVEFSATKPALALPNRTNFPSTTDKNLLREIARALLNDIEPTKTDSFVLPQQPGSFGFMGIFRSLVSASLKKCDYLGWRSRILGY
ncbi:MAG TPA: hypothetical protein VNK03_03795 [Gammaproteobacteria bacterium]|nr:hypothetical protein [Gammaproteobacteria bacterium]